MLAVADTSLTYAVRNFLGPGMAWRGRNHGTRPSSAMRTVSCQEVDKQRIPSKHMPCKFLPLRSVRHYHPPSASLLPLCSLSLSPSPFPFPPPPPPPFSLSLSLPLSLSLQHFAPG